MVRNVILADPPPALSSLHCALYSSRSTGHTCRTPTPCSSESVTKDGFSHFGGMGRGGGATWQAGFELTQLHDPNMPQFVTHHNKDVYLQLKESVYNQFSELFIESSSSFHKLRWEFSTVGANKFCFMHNDM